MSDLYFTLATELRSSLYACKSYSNQNTNQLIIYSLSCQSSLFGSSLPSKIVAGRFYVMSLDPTKPSQKQQLSGSALSKKSRKKIFQDLKLPINNFSKSSVDKGVITSLLLHLARMDGSTEKGRILQQKPPSPKNRPNNGAFLGGHFWTEGGQVA